MGVVFRDASSALHAAWRGGCWGLCNPTGAAADVNGSSKTAQRGHQAKTFTTPHRNPSEAHARRGAGDDDRGEADR